MELYIPLLYFLNYILTIPHFCSGRLYEIVVKNRNDLKRAKNDDKKTIPGQKQFLVPPAAAGRM